MTIVNSLKDLVKPNIRIFLVTATLMIIDFMLYMLIRTVKIAMIYMSQSKNLHVTESSREIVHSDDNQNQKHPIRETKGNRPVNRKQRKSSL